MKVTVVRFPGRKKSWCVRYYVQRARRMKFFKTREEAETHASDLRLLDRKGASLEKVEDAIRLVAGTGYDIAELVRIGLQSLQTAGTKDSCLQLTFSEAVKKYFEQAKKKKLRMATLLAYRGHFMVLNRKWGDRIIGCISDAEVEAYLLNYNTPNCRKGRPSLRTLQTYLRNMQMVMRAAGVVRPLTKVVLPREDREIRFFSTEQVRVMLTEAKAHERGMLALALFAGLRPERLNEIPSNYINVKERTIRIPAAVSKTHSPDFLETVTPTAQIPEFRPGPPEVLWMWLERYPFQPRYWKALRTRLRIMLGNQWIHDGCRHTAATYYCTKYGVAATAELLTHSDTGLVRKHYAGIATREQAEAFFSLTPDRVPLPRYARRDSKIKVSPEEMARLVRTKTMNDVAKQIGCSSTSVRKFCQARGIPTPGKGRWVTRKLISGAELFPLDDPESRKYPENVVTESTLPRSCDPGPSESSRSDTDGLSDGPSSSQ